MYMAYQKCIIARIITKILAIPLLGPAINMYKNPPPQTHRVMSVGPVLKGVHNSEVLHVKYKCWYSSTSGEFNDACLERAASSSAGEPSVSASGGYQGPWPHWQSGDPSWTCANLPALPPHLCPSHHTCWYLPSTCGIGRYPWVPGCIGHDACRLSCHLPTLQAGTVHQQPSGPWSPPYGSCRVPARRGVHGSPWQRVARGGWVPPQRAASTTVSDVMVGGNGVDTLFSSKWGVSKSGSSFTMVPAAGEVGG